MKSDKKINSRKIVIAILAFVLISVFLMIDVKAQTSLTQYYQPSPLSYYSSSIETYWPAYGKENCLARQDFIVQILPGSCSPAVLRTDLLEEQDVPVFCQLTGIKINPLIEVPEITSISFKGQLQKDIAGIGFHPARAALQTWGSTLLGSPVLNNLGYLVVVVRRQQAENATPDWIEANLTALIQYNAEKALGIGKAGFLLPVLSDDEWKQYYKQYSFWNGKAYIRALETGKDSAGDYVRLAIYLDANKQLTSFILHAGQTSQEIYLPGYYCSAALKVNLQNIATPDIKAKIRIGDDEMWLAKSQRFLDDNCFVKDIQPNTVGGGTITISCKDSGLYTLEIDPPSARITIQDSAKHETSDDFSVSQELVKNKVYLGYIGSTDNAISTKLRNPSQDFVVLINPKEAFDSEYFNNLNVIVNSILKGKSYSGFKLIGSIITSFNKKADKSAIKWGETVDCLCYSVCQDKSVEKGIEAYLGNKNFQIIGASGDLCNQGTSFEGYHFTFDKVIGSIEKNYNSEKSGFGKLLENYFKEAESAYTKVADYYGGEKKTQQEGAEKIDYYGAEALHEAAKLAGELKKFKTQEELLDRIIKDYPDSGIAETAKQELDLIKIQDRSKASSYINTAGSTYYTILEDIKEPGLGDISADLWVDDKTETYAQNQIIKGSITLSTITDEWVEFSYNNKDGNAMTPLRVKQGNPITITTYENGKEEKVNIKVVKINLKKEASLTLTPAIMRAQTQTNFTFKIGIEKRAIKLSPEKTKELINELNDSIVQWEKVVNNLGNLVKTWKGTCFAGSAYLVVKNFINNLGGAGTARTEAMKYWKTICQSERAEGKFKTQSECYYKHATEIDSSVGTIKGIYESTNKEIEEIKTKKDVLQKYSGSLGIFNEQYLNESACIAASQEYINKYNAEFKSGDDSFKSSDLFTKDNVEMLSKNSRIYCNDVKDILSNIKLQQECTTGALKSATAFCKQLSTTLYTDMKEWKTTVSELQVAKVAEDASKKAGFKFTQPISSVIVSKKLKGTANVPGEVKKPDDDELNLLKQAKIEEKEDYITREAFQFGNGEVSTLIIPLKLIGTDKEGKNLYAVKNAVKLKDSGEVKGVVTKNELEEIKTTIGTIVGTKAGEYSNAYKNPEVKFWETGTYKGLPAVLPLGKYAVDGWYVATEPYSLGTQGTKAYTEAAQPINYWICNVNVNNLEEWETSGHGDDNPCIQFIMQTGMSESTYTSIPNSADMIKLARQYLLEASRQYGKKTISVGGKSFNVGKPAVTIPQYECEDFMSPTDCHLMFNLCDPVLCPSSRCDYGGRYPVADVVQTGVIGSLLLCLPNAKEGIIVPICLTGVHAGLDNFVQIMKATRDCLQENLKTGRNVGICDQIKSIYLCEFFWKQAAPLAKVGIPWLLESISGKSTHGGGEYLFVQDAWTKAQESVNYFTNYYGVNAFKAFQSRSIESAGTEVCKAWVSANYPSTADMFDKLLEPESPTQFYATLSEDVLTEATVPSTSHYKVYFRIYAGKDEGVYYSIYLRGQPQTEYYLQLGEMQVPNAIGYIPLGEQVDRSTDFTGPSGYKELCVRINSQEECGFGQVTTSFAMTELKDSYLAEQATQPITKESECIEGTSSMTAAALNLNLQAGISEVTQPAIYKRGIIRVCATNNPTATTEPTRWQAVGYCGDKKIICWLDTVSLNQSITDQGILGETLDKAKEMAKEIDAEGFWDKEKTDTAKQKADQNKAELINKDNTGKLDKILSKEKLQFADADKVEEDIKKAIEPTISNYSEIIKKSVLNKEKARAQTEIGGIYEKITRLIYENKIKKEEVEPLPENIKVGAILKASETGLSEDIKVTEVEPSKVSALAEGITSKKTYQYETKTKDWTEVTIKKIGTSAVKTTEQETEVMSEGSEKKILLNGKEYSFKLVEMDEKGITFQYSTDEGYVTHFTYPSENEFYLDLNGDGSNDFLVKITDKGSDFVNLEITQIKSLWQKATEAVSSLFTSEKSSESSTQQTSSEIKLNIKKIVIDAGHGGKGSNDEFYGACGPAGSCEKDLMLSIAKKLKEKLENVGFEAELTREADSKDLSLTDRIKKANDEKADLFISLHANSRSFCRIPLLGAQGTETYVFCECSKGVLTNGVEDKCKIEDCYRKNEFAEKSELLASSIQQKITNAIGTTDNGVKGADFLVLQYAEMPAVLVETAYICNTNEEKILNSESGQEKIANAIFEAIKQVS